MGKPRETHEQIAERIIRTYKSVCDNCGHINDYHDSKPMADSIERVYWGCSYCVCGQWVPVPPLKLAEIIDRIYLTGYQDGDLLLDETHGKLVVMNILKEKL